MLVDRNGTEIEGEAEGYLVSTTVLIKDLCALVETLGSV